MQYLVFLILLASVDGTTLLETLKIALNTSDEQVINDQDPLRREYDYIVVGGGTAGSTVAGRLAESSNWEVCLLEAGGRDVFFTDIPVLVGILVTLILGPLSMTLGLLQLLPKIPLTLTNFMTTKVGMHFLGDLQGTEMDWQYKTEPNPNYCTGSLKGECSLPRGKILGGSSVLNYMLATRGNPRDYDNWEALGNPGWSFKDVLPYFIKAENMTIPELRNDKMHGNKGPLAISHTKYRTKLVEAFMKSGKELGYLLGDYNGITQNQFSYFQFTKFDGRRVNNARAHLYPVMKERRKNLQVCLYAFVTKILLEDGVAKGVSVDYDGGSYNIFARKEVIISAGSYNSPQLLMLSGIGPKSQLEKFKIPQVVDLPVGKNYQDHVSFAGLFFLTNITDSELNSTCIANDPKNFVNYMKDRYGPYEIPGGNEGVFFYDFDKPNSKNGYPEIEMHFSSSSPKPEEKLRGFTDQVYERVFTPYRNYITWAVQPILMHPKSRGSVELRSGDPHDKVKIIPNYFEHPDDVKFILKGIKKALDIGKTRAFKHYGSKLNPSIIPGCESHKHGSENYWKCAIRVMTISNYHPTSTCTMAPDGVVDPRLRVHGISKLRVVDASIMPLVPAAHTNIPTNMLAEKGAAMIIEDNNI